MGAYAKSAIFLVCLSALATARTAYADTGSDTSGNNLQEVVSGIKPGDRVVSNALVLQNTVEQ